MNNTILLTFADEETATYIKTVNSRKGTTLESYILDNFEWDDTLECMIDGKIKAKVCKRCDYNDGCPDKKEKK